MVLDAFDIVSYSLGSCFVSVAMFTWISGRFASAGFEALVQNQTEGSSMLNMGDCTMCVAIYAAMNTVSRITPTEESARCSQYVVPASVCSRFK